MATDSRVIPLLSAQIAYPGTEGFLSVRQAGWYDVLEHSRAFATISRRTSGEPELEHVEGVGLCCRPFLVQKDTRSSQFETDGGAFSEFKPSTGAPRVYWVEQHSAAIDTVWLATSEYVLPSNPHVAVQFSLEDTPAGHDEVTYPPRVRFEFGVTAGGEPQWGVRVDQTNGWQLEQYVGGDWQTVADLGQPHVVTQFGKNRYLILIRPMRGQLCISMDYGRTYTRHLYYDQAGVTVRQGNWQVRGQGHKVAFNLSQLEYHEGTFTSAPKTYPGFFSVIPTFLGSRYEAPSGTAAVWLNLTSGATARYRVTLTPDSTGSTPFAVYRTPVVYATRMKWSAAATFTFATYALLENCLSCEIDKGSMELDQSTASLTFWKDAAEQFTWPYANRPLIDIQAGWLEDDGSTRNYTVFRGYVRTVEPSQSDFGRAFYSLTVDNVSIRFRETTWTEFDSLPLGGQSLNDALDEILASEGMDPSYRLWWFTGDLILLPAGSAEDPPYWPRPGESKWETMQQMCQDYGLELGITDDGRFATIPRDWADQFSSRTWEGAPADDATAGIHSMRTGFDSSEQYTCIIVKGTAEDGGAVYGFGVDNLAENVPGSPHFYPWRKTLREELPGTSTVGRCIARAQGLALEKFRLKVEANLEVPWDPGRGRRTGANIAGTNLGVNEADLLFLLTAQHRIRMPISDCRSTYGLRRQNAS